MNCLLVVVLEAPLRSGVCLANNANQTPGVGLRLTTSSQATISIKTGVATRRSDRLSQVSVTVVAGRGICQRDAAGTAEIRAGSPLVTVRHATTTGESGYPAKSFVGNSRSSLAL
jgi:hypothetical protein